MQTAEVSFLHRVAGLSLRDRAKSSDIQRELRVESNQLRRFMHLIRIPPGHLPLEVY